MVDGLADSAHSPPQVTPWVREGFAGRTPEIAAAKAACLRCHRSSSLSAAGGFGI